VETDFLSDISRTFNVIWMHAQALDHDC